jgi:hypothetical protein
MRKIGGRRLIQRTNKHRPNEDSTSHDLTGSSMSHTRSIGGSDYFRVADYPGDTVFL